MKRIFSIILLTIFGFVTNVWADNISIENAKILQGGTQTIALNLDNTATDYAAFQMDVYLPQGLSIDKGNTSLTDRAETGGSITIGKQKDGAFRLVYSSLTLTPITGTSGTLVNLCLKASADFAGGMVNVKNITFGTTGSKTVKMNDVSFETSKATRVVVTGNTIKMQYGDAVPELTYQLNNDNVSGSPVLTCEATSTSPVGSYPIRVSQGSLDADVVECVDGTLIIEKAPLTISAGSYTKKQGDAMPTFKAAYSGFKNGETEAVLTKQPVFSTTATEASAPGSYPVTVSGAEAQNYDISYRQGTLTVAQADAVVITAKDYARWYGSNNPTFEYDVQGAALDGVPEITCEATKNSPVGTYTIVVKRGTVKNYNVTFENGTLVIVKTPLTISAGNYTMKQGEAMPTFKATYGGYGFQNGETEAVLTKRPVFSTTANETSAPGIYPVTVSGAEAQNYDISYEQGTLTVTEHSVVSVRNYTRQYGDDNPTFEYDVQGTTLDGVPEIVCEATKNSPVGTYAIVLKQGTVKNNDVSFVNGTLTVDKAPLVVSAGNYTMVRGEAMPVFKAIYSGFKNGETEAVLTKQPVFSTTANENSEIGEYPVYVSGAEAQNYEMAYVQGVLVVEAKKPQTIVWNQGIIAKVGSTIEMDATATSGMPVRYSTFKPVVGSAFHKPEIDGNKIKFPEEGNYMIIAIQDGNDEYEMAADTIQVNVLSDDDGLMCIDGVYYKYNDASKTTLKVVRGYKPYSGKVMIPSTANGLPVVCVDDFSLYASNFLTELVIGDNVTDCGGQFAGACPNLRVVTLPGNNIAEFNARYPFNCDGNIKGIHCRSQIPYKADETTFNSSVDYTTCILYVPTGTKQAYQEAQEWCKFVNIVEEDVPSGIGNVQVVSDSLSWYTLQGIKLPAKPAAAGIYIHGGKKVIVK